MPKLLITVSDEHLWKLSGEGRSYASSVIYKALEQYFNSDTHVK